MSGQSQDRRSETVSSCPYGTYKPFRAKDPAMEFLNGICRCESCISDSARHWGGHIIQQALMENRRRRRAAIAQRN